MTDVKIPAFNLWTEPWISLERSDGKIEDASIRQALLDAKAFRAIYDPSPLTIVGIHRLLVAILQFVIQPQKEADLQNLWKLGEFPRDPIEAFGRQYASRFDLFSEKEPFLQSADICTGTFQDVKRQHVHKRRGEC